MYGTFQGDESCTSKENKLLFRHYDAHAIQSAHLESDAHTRCGYKYYGFAGAM